MRIPEQKQRRKRYLSRRFWWRKPLWGYLLALPLVASGLLVPLLLQHFGFQEVFSSAPDFVTIVIMAWVWGTGPAIVAIALGALKHNYFFIPPYRSLSWGWQKTLPLLSLVLMQLVVLWLAIALKSARQQTLLARQELQERVRELEEANQAKQRFLSMASHELKTPVTLVLTEVQYALRRITKQQDVSPEVAILKGLLEKVNQQVHYLQKLIADILDLSLVGAREMPLAVGRCDVGSTCQKIVEELRASSGRSIALQAPRAPILLDADCERIGQVVGNLLTNAIKYSPPAYPITVRLSQSETACCMQVHNNDHPIAPQDQEHLFEPFYRSASAQASQEEGSGLGLAISKDIVERHNGQIWVESSPQKGTSFFVQLPLKSPFS